MRRSQVIVTLDGGQQRIGFPRANGRFTVNDVPPGSHALDVIYVACCVYYQASASSGNAGLCFTSGLGAVDVSLHPAAEALPAGALNVPLSSLCFLYHHQLA